MNFFASRFAAIFLLLSALAFPGVGCAGLESGLRSSGDGAWMRSEAQKRGLQLPDPTALTRATQNEVRTVVGSYGTPTERMRRLVRYLVDSDRVHFQYSLNHSLTAEQAFQAHRGDCMAYTNLYVALARALDVPASFVRRTELPYLYAHEDVLYASSHMAAANHTSWGTLLVDFSMEHTDAQVSRYRDTSDADAFALFYNNLAMEELAHGEGAAAEKTLRFLVEMRPHLKELAGNLGIVLLHERRPLEALAVYEAALQRFPGELNLYTNAAQAARYAGQGQLADSLMAKAESMSGGNDPSFLFNRGLVRYEKASYQRAAEDFRDAARTQPSNAVILTWMVRALLSSGQTSEGVRAFEHLCEVAPASHFLSQLALQFPVLAAERARRVRH